MNIVRTLLVVALLTLAGCSGSPLSFLTGGGPNVAANTQLGQENNQTLGISESNEQTIVRPQARDISQVSGKQPIVSDNIEKVEVEQTPPWIILLLIVGWLAPSPSEIGRSIRSLFRRE